MCAYTADLDRCDCNTIHEDVVNDVRDHMPDENNLLDLNVSSFACCLQL